MYFMQNISLNKCKNLNVAKATKKLTKFQFKYSNDKTWNKTYTYK